MKRYQLSKAGVSAQEGINRFNGNQELYEKMLKGFLKETSFASLCEALEQKDIDSAFRAAHSLKGVAGNLSMNRLFEDVVPVVEALRAGTFENVEENMEKVKQDYQDVIEAIGVES